MLAPDDVTLIEVWIDGIATGWHYPRWMLRTEVRGASIEMKMKPWAKWPLAAYVSALALLIDWGWIKPRGFDGAH